MTPALHWIGIFLIWLNACYWSYRIGKLIGQAKEAAKTEAAESELRQFRRHCCPVKTKDNDTVLFNISVN